MNTKLAKAIAEFQFRAKEDTEKLEMSVVCKSAEEDKRLFYAVVLEPMTEVTEEGDTHGHVMKSEEIEESAHYYMEMGATVFKQHIQKADVTVVESYIAPVDFTPEGGELITKGSWVMAVKVNDDVLWESIKKGDVTAFSPGGYGIITDL